VVPDLKNPVKIYTTLKSVLSKLLRANAVNYPAMKIILSLILFALFTFQSVTAQTAKEANPADVSSLDAIMRSVYDVISGYAGKARDWDRFNSLFVSGARLIPTGKNAQTGIRSARTYSPEEYRQRVEQFFAKEGFFEREKARRVEIYGNIAHVFSTYESFHSLSDKTPFARGINSFQLLNDGKRWWVVTIYWQAETAEAPIPKKYLKNN